MAPLGITNTGINDTPEDRSHTASGHKANLSNPHTSTTSKEHSAGLLRELGGEDAFYSKHPAPMGDHSAPGMRNRGNVVGGLKA
ncbi:hypothetical protein EJ06DRAFT_473913 [Trichodelitschia bisporula]|uniref:Uncharacterized protein n=1 Tax=Trichodelitschia bisporula TaxID=703511 RepID=A0A6G1I2S6_9PEZI|nr:hypothetical protein EJ06DRAFT_473913 [Trichodelitschia bisporula]